jgi:hypothetical protein
MLLESLTRWIKPAGLFLSVVSSACSPTDSAIAFVNPTGEPDDQLYYDCRQRVLDDIHNIPLEQALFFVARREAARSMAPTPRS